MVAMNEVGPGHRVEGGQIIFVNCSLEETV